MMDKLKVLVATHKLAWIPQYEPYLPILVGVDEGNTFSKNIQKDNTGDNISSKHRYYSELSALYWGWKNLQCDYLGLCQYRRYFVKEPCQFDENGKWQTFVMGYDDYMDCLNQSDIILPKPFYFGKTTVGQQYDFCHSKEDRDIIGQIILKDYPCYAKSFNRVMNSNGASYCNMFVTKKDLINEYCKWLFDITFKAEQKTDLNVHIGYQERVFGYLAERLFNVWIDYHHLSVNYCDMLVFPRKL